MKASRQANRPTSKRDAAQGKSVGYEPAPLRVFVVWNPVFTHGQKLADELYSWFGGPDRELHRAGLGIPVHPWSTQDAEEVPPPIPIDTQDRTVVIALIDAEFAGRTAWRRWLDRLPSTGVTLFPWAVHPAAVHIDCVSRGQLLGAGACDEAKFRRLATEACALALLGTHDLQVFVSYARRDGRDIASEVRRVLQEYGHVRAFLDEHDIQPGEDWHNKIRSALGEGAAMVAIVTDSYASRPWCREELRAFREPRPEPSGAHWWLPPVFILDNLGGRSTRSMFEVGSAPSARWDPSRSLELIDLLIREVLMGAQQRARMSRRKHSHPDEHFINWVPDTWTLLALKRSAVTVARIIYPGDGLPSVERERLQKVFPDLTFQTLEEATHLSSRPAVPLRVEAEPGEHKVVAFSMSDPPATDLAARGLSSPHLDDVVLRVARLILRRDADIAYGGQPKAGFTAALVEDTGTLVLRPRLINYLGWPWAAQLMPARVADDLGVCRYVKVEAPAGIKPGADPKNPWLTMLAATHTRWAIVSGRHVDLDGRPVGSRVAQVVFGGKLTQYAGSLPGVLEEAMIALRQGLGLFIVGGFGGAAGALAGFLAGDQDWVSPQPAGGPGSRKLDQARRKDSEVCRKFFQSARRRRDLRNGLSWEENLRLMQTLDGVEIVRLIDKGLNSCLTCNGRRSPQ